jgi:hypothetical protein
MTINLTLSTKGYLIMKKIFLVVMIVLLYGCGYRMAVLIPGKTDLDFAVLVDIRENAAGDEQEASYMYKIKNQTEFDMYSRLKDRGVKVRLIKDKSEYIPGGKNYLLRISYGKYVGRTLTRTLVMHYTLYNDKGEVIFEKDLSAATRRGWSNVVSSVNQQAVGHIDRMFAQNAGKRPGKIDQQAQPSTNKTVVTEVTSTTMDAK